MNLKQSGYCDRILRVDLTRGTITTEPLPEKAVPLVIGGKGLGAYPFAQRATSRRRAPLAGESFDSKRGSAYWHHRTNCRALWQYDEKSGDWYILRCLLWWIFRANVQYAGYDAVVLQGAASEPTMLVIDDDRIELRSAKHLWGKNISHATEEIWRDLGRDWQSLVIGHPGEKRTNIASIFNDTRALARGGVGAVMGSKNLKAIAVRGTGRVTVANRQRFDRALQLANRAVRMSSGVTRMTREGTANILEIVNYLGALPTRNFQQGQFEQAENITGEAWRAKSWKRDYACFGCPIACSKVTRAVDGKELEGPEYQTIYAVGSNCGIADHDAIIRMSLLCDEHGIDTISAGAIVAFVMELFERGMMGAKELDGIEPRFGDCRSALALVEKLAKVEGCGEWLSEGVAKIAERYPGSTAFAMHVKGLEMPAYHPNAAKGMALGFAVSERGACHLRGAPISEMLGGTDALSEDGKAHLFREHQAESALWNSVVLCCFPGFGMSLKELAQLVSAATGFEYATVKEFEMVGERISALARLFNVREGFTRANDTLPERNLKQPLAAGPAQGQVVKLDSMLSEYYTLMGWDSNGIPTPERLTQLGLAPLLPRAKE